MNIIYKFKAWLPLVTSATFDKKILDPLMQKLWVDASMDMDNWLEVEYDNNWKIGYKVWGSTVESFIWLRNENIKPTANELEEVILALPRKYKYHKDAFYPDEFDGYTLTACLSSDV